MIIEPSKMVLSLITSVFILMLGGFILSGQEPRIYTEDFKSLASSSSLAQISDEQSVANTGDPAQKYAQNNPENVKMEAEAMTASIESYSVNNNSDWSLELISDHALEITR